MSKAEQKTLAAAEVQTPAAEPEKKSNGNGEAVVPAGAAATGPKPPPIAVGERGLVLTTLEEMVRAARYAIAAGYAKGMTLEEAIAAMQFGAEVGLTPFQALTTVAVINGKPSLYGDGAKAVVEASGELEDLDEWIEHQGKRLPGGRFPEAPDDTTTAFCMIKRRGRTAQVRSFSVADAKRSGLWNKTGRNGEPTPWITYPQRMLAARAGGFARRDVFPDKLKGFFDEHEARDVVIDVTPAPEIAMPKRISEVEAEKEEAPESAVGK